MKKTGSFFYTATGHVSLALGIAGIFLPIVPTTPFLLLSAACYAKGSEKFYMWLTTHRYLGPYINDWRNKKGIPLKTKIWALFLMLSVMSLTVFFFVPLLLVKILLGVIAAAVTVYILSLPTKKS